MELPERKDYSKSIVTDDGEVVQVHDSAGREIPDPVPVAPPLGYQKPLSMFDQMRAQIRAEHHRLRQLELEELVETREQANDFEVDDDIENMPSLYEERFDPVDFEVRNRLRQAEHRASVAAAVDKLPLQQKELLNGDSLRSEVEPRNEQRGKAGGRAGVRQSVAQYESDGESVQVAADKRDVPKGVSSGGGSGE